jgi:hypothetical protein
VTRFKHIAIATSIVTLANCGAVCGCEKKTSPAPGPTASASASASSAEPIAIPIDAEEVRKAVNPKGEAPYAGPVGSVKGTVRVSGDASPQRQGVAEQVTAKCPQSAKQYYSLLFREGEGRRVADAFVAVTGYQGFVPAPTDAVRVNIRDCTFGERTIGLTFGQRLDVSNLESQPHMPDLVGAPMKALMVALAKADPIRMYPTRPGRYVLTDAMNTFMYSDVLVVKYPTHAVTGLDGKFEINGIPVGEVTVSALLPSIMQTAEKKITVRERATTDVDLVIEFDAAKYSASKAAASAKAPAPAPATSRSVR